MKEKIQNIDLYSLLGPDYMIFGKETGAYTFTRGHYTVGRCLIDRFNDRLRMKVDGLDNVQGFIINHSISGGTGSGLGTLICERLAIDYRKKIKINNIILSNQNKSTNICHFYNELLAFHQLIDY